MVPKTSHSLNPVPFFAVLPEGYRDEFVVSQLEGSTLANLAATTLTLLGLNCPEGYHPSLLEPV